MGGPPSKCWIYGQDLHSFKFCATKRIWLQPIWPIIDRLGVSRAFLFLDRCTDRTAEIAARFSWVSVIHRDRDPADRFMSNYQVKCMDAGLAMAREEGFEWLLHLDADEFASGEDRTALSAWARSTVGRESGRVDAANLGAMLTGVPGNVEMILLRPREAVATPLANEEAPWSLKYFAVRGFWPRAMMNPLTGKLQQLTRPIGHVLGKSIVRTSADVQALSAHRWTRRQGSSRPDRLPIPSTNRGFHYHFVVTSFRHWYSKYRKFAEYPPVWEKGTAVDFPKQAWKEATAQWNVPEAEEYFQRWVLTDPRSLRLARFTGKVVRDSFVSDLVRLELGRSEPALNTVG